MKTHSHAFQSRHGELEWRVLERTADLKRSEEKVRLLVESIVDYAIYMLDANGYISSWNTGAERIKGYRAKEIVGKHFSTCFPKEDIAAGKPDQLLAEARQTGRVESDSELRLTA